MTAIDLSIGAVLGTATGITVTPAAAVSLRLVGGGGPIGSPALVTATALDPYGNVATSYNGTLHLATTDANATVSADAAAVNGVATFTVNSLTLGAQTLTVNDVANPAMIGTEAVVNTPGLGVEVRRDAARRRGRRDVAVVPGHRLTITTATSRPATGGSCRSAAPTPRWPGRATTASPRPTRGAHLHGGAATAGSQSLTVARLTTTRRELQPDRHRHLPRGRVFAQLHRARGTTAGVAQTMTVTLRDAYGNIATGYRGTLNSAAATPRRSCPRPTRSPRRTPGVHTFSVTFKSSGGQLFTVTDSANPLMTAAPEGHPDHRRRDVRLRPPAPSNVTVGVAFSLTVTAVDAYGNTITGYPGKVHFTGPSGIPLDYTFTAADAGRTSSPSRSPRPARRPSACRTRSPAFKGSVA